MPYDSCEFGLLLIPTITVQVGEIPKFLDAKRISKEKVISEGSVLFQTLPKQFSAISCLHLCQNRLLMS